MEEEKKVHDGGGRKNGGVGREKRGNNNKGGIVGSFLKDKEGDNYNNVDSWDDQDFDIDREF